MPTRHSNVPLPPPARLVRRAFDRAAAGYDAAAVLQQQVGDELLARVAELNLKPTRIVDLGAGTGRASRALKSRFRRASVLALDSAPRMLAVARDRQGWFQRHQLVCADACRLPIRDAVIDLIHSNLVLHWVGDLDAALAEMARVTVEGGALCFTTFGPDTLTELRAAYAAQDDAVHVNHFLDMHDVGDALVRAGFRDPVLDVERYTLTYAGIDGLLSDLKSTGATALPQRSPGLGGRRLQRQVAQAYEAERVEGRLPATCEVIFGHAVRDSRRDRARSDGEIRVPLASLKRIRS